MAHSQLEPMPHGKAQRQASAAYAWYVAALLTVAFIIAIIDRQILSLLVQPITRDLQISDTGFGLLHGVAFGLFYALVGIPIARLADRANRRNIILAGVVLWGLATAACGLASSFGALFLARMAVGIGEAALSPAAVSILADVMPRRRLGLAVSLYAMGALWGTGAAYLLGGAVVALVTAHPVSELPLLGEVRSWQLTFFVVALPALLVAPLIGTIREPRRRELQPAAAAEAGSGVWDFVRSRRRAVVSLYAGFSLLVLVTVTLFAWMPAVFMRRFAWSAAEIGYAFGLIVIAAGTVGIIGGGALIDRLVRGGWDDAPLRIGAASLLVFGMLVAVTPNVADGTLAMALCVPLIFVLTFPAGAALAAIQTMAPNRLRAQMNALFVLVSNLAAMLLGPPLVGLCTDLVFADPQAVGTSLSLVCGVAATLGSVVLALGARPYREARASAPAAPAAAAGMS